jgi:hypothetical protein
LTQRHQHQYRSTWNYRVHNLAEVAEQVAFLASNPEPSIANSDYVIAGGTIPTI